MRKTKVIFLMHQIITGGIEKVLLQILEKLKKYPEYEITVLSHRRVTEKWALDFFREHGIALINHDIYAMIRRRPSFWPIRRVWKFFVTRRVRKIHKDLFSQYDLIVDYFNMSFQFDLRKAPNPKIAFGHYSINAFNRYSHIRYLRYYDKFVCLSDSFMRDFINEYPSFKDNIVKIYNPIDCERVRKNLKSAQPPVGEKYFVSVARLETEEKDPETLIHAFAKFAAGSPDAKLYMLGDGPARVEMESLSAELGMQEKIKFMGTVDNPFGYMKNCTGLIMSSRSEGLPNVLLEAQCLGALCIASNCKSGVADVLLDGQAGILFPVGNADALADIMGRVWRGEVDRDTMLQNATDGLVRFDADTIVAQMDNLFKEAIKDCK